MIGSNRGVHSFLFLALASLAVPSCAPPVAVESLPTVEKSLRDLGKRLSASLSIGELNRIAGNGDRVLALLNRRERDALARGYLRFQVDKPTDVIVATTPEAKPFWLADLGFRPMEGALRDSETNFILFQKRYEPGWVGLGVNGLDRHPQHHYGVFLRSSDGTPITPRLHKTDAWQIATAEVGTSLTWDLARPITLLPDLLRGATMIRPAHDSRHASILARGKVWKTHVVSKYEPDQIVITFSDDPSRELVWTWRTDDETKASLVQIRSAGSSIREVSGDSEIVALPELLNDPVIRRHSVKVTELEPNTLYEYSLGDGSKQGMSAWAKVKTPPRDTSDLCLLYMGDPQCGLEGWGKLLAKAYKQRPDINAILIAGDLVDRGNERSNWDHFFLRAAGVFDNVPVMPAVGNHEYLDRGPCIYRSVFDLPKNGPKGISPELVYHFEIGDAFIAVLDSTLAVTDPAAAKTQAVWLDHALSRTKQTWKLVMFHHPVYASHISREQPQLRDAWVPVFDRYHVDLVLQGHDHSYMRTYPLKANKRMESSAEGTVYLVTVSGDKYYDQDTRGYAEVGFTHRSTYQTIDIKTHENRLIYRAFDGNGKELDQFTIEKQPRGKQLASRPLQVQH